MDFSFKPKLNKAYLKKSVARGDLETFREQLLKFVDQLDPNQPEEPAKTLLATFLCAAFYGNGCQVNVHGLTDEEIALVGGQ